MILFCGSNVLMYQGLATGKVKKMFLTQPTLIRPERAELEER